MKRKFLIVLSLAIIAGLFCFFVFSKENKNDIEIKIEETKEEKEPAKESEENEIKEIIEEQKEETDKEIEEEIKKEKKIVKNEEIKSEIKEAEIEEKSESFDTKLKSYAKEVLESFSFTEGGMVFNLPDTGENVHLGLSVQIFKSNGIGDDLLFRYSSDDGWMKKESKIYGPQSIAIDLKEAYSELKILLQIKVFDLLDGTIQIYDVIWNESNDYEIICGETRS